MIIWLDAQLPPSAAAWITVMFGVNHAYLFPYSIDFDKQPPTFTSTRHLRWKKLFLLP